MVKTMISIWIAAGFILGVVPLAAQAAELKRFPLDSMEGVLTQSGVQVDKTVSSDRNGSLRIDATGPTVVRLFEVQHPDVKDTPLIYQAKVRTEGIKGQVYLEMWCSFPGKGEFFSRGLGDVLTGTSGWKTLKTPFFLKKGESPDTIKLNLVVDGKGTAWIDDIRVLEGRSWFGLASYIPGPGLGILGGILGTLVGVFAPRGKAKKFVLGLEVATLSGSILLLVAGVVAFLSGRPHDVWYGVGFPGLLGTVVMSWMLPMTIRVYGMAEQRRLVAQDLT